MIGDDRFEAAWSQHGSSVLRYCVYSTGTREAGEDVAAETFARFLDKGAAFAEVHLAAAPPVPDAEALARAERKQTWEDWIDVDRRVTRTEARELPGGRLNELGVRVGNMRRFMAVQYELDLKKNEYVCNGIDQVIEMPDTTPITSPGGGMVDLLRTALASGEAKQVGREVIDGREYWVVELSRQPEGDEFPTVVRATMRVGDYHLRSFEQRSQQRNGNGHGSGSMVLEYTVWEVLDRAALPVDFFSLDAPVKAAKPGTVIETREEPDWDAP